MQVRFQSANDTQLDRMSSTRSESKSSVSKRGGPNAVVGDLDRAKASTAKRIDPSQPCFTPHSLFDFLQKDKFPLRKPRNRSGEILTTLQTGASDLNNTLLLLASLTSSHIYYRTRLTYLFLYLHLYTYLYSYLNPPPPAADSAVPTVGQRVPEI